MIYIPSPTGDHDAVHMVTEVWRDETHGSTSYLVGGGPKRYLRVWDQGPVEWSWVVHDDAVCLLLTPVAV